MKPWEEKDSTPFSLWQDGEKIATFKWERYLALAKAAANACIAIDSNSPEVVAESIGEMYALIQKFVYDVHESLDELGEYFEEAEKIIVKLGGEG